jgi:hypothetical protein
VGQSDCDCGAYTFPGHFEEKAPPRAWRRSASTCRSRAKYLRSQGDGVVTPTSIPCGGALRRWCCLDMSADAAYPAIHYSCAPMR